MLWPNLFVFSDTGFLVVRIVLAVVFAYHAVPKLKDPKGTAAMMGKPNAAWFPAVLGASEVLAAISVLLGIWLQLGALIMVVVMVGANVMKMGTWKVPFSASDKTGWEFDLALLALALLLLLAGGGSFLILL